MQPMGIGNLRVFHSGAKTLTGREQDPEVIFALGVCANPRCYQSGGGAAKGGLGFSAAMYSLLCCKMEIG